MHEVKAERREASWLRFCLLQYWRFWDSCVSPARMALAAQNSVANSSLGGFRGSRRWNASHSAKERSGI